MLAQSFMSAADLGITEPQRDALQKVLVLLETGKLSHVSVRDLPDDPDRDDADPKFNDTFNMRWWTCNHTCGTAGCIGGTAEMISGVSFGIWMQKQGLRDLFWPIRVFENEEDLNDITPAQAARALRSYLTTGNANWAEAVA